VGDLVPATRGGGAEEDAESVAGWPVGQVTQVYYLAGRFGGGRHPDVEVDLVTPRRTLCFDRKRVPYGLRRLRVVEPRLGRHSPGGDPNRPLHDCQVRRGFRRVAREDRKSVV